MAMDLMGNETQSSFPNPVEEEQLRREMLARINPPGQKRMSPVARPPMAAPAVAAPAVVPQTFGVGPSPFSPIAPVPGANFGGLGGPLPAPASPLAATPPLAAKPPAAPLPRSYYDLMAELADLGPEEKALAEQMAWSKKLRETAAPEMRSAGRVTQAAHPLEFLAAGIKQYQGHAGVREGLEAQKKFSEKIRERIMRDAMSDKKKKRADEMTAEGTLPSEMEAYGGA